MDTKLTYPYREQLKEMLLKKQEALIKEIKPEKETLTNEGEWEFTLTKKR